MNRSDELLTRLRGGEILTATDPAGHTIRCSVEVSAPHLGVLWARDLHTGQRILIPAEEFHLAKAPPEPESGRPGH
ncbi:hypothetical protein [Arthrobacter mobilis]|uniref:Uncharacterized protein n=1 Tax=Arthrobacter mobilis TaxID=2724944 RepID=A0A7X6K6C1_9MICC|nr:hypothetical protein [Arthrobacter mobilis]NKX55509.1 hypothetical protein [Arthrobacter mobilis]